MMRLKILILFFLSAPVFAAENKSSNNKMPITDECGTGPDTQKKYEAVLQKIKNTKSCSIAVSLAKKCAVGAAGDIGTSAEAIKKCELGLKSATADEKKAYQTMLNRCAEKHKGHEGSMSASSNAFCNLSVAEFFSEMLQPYEDLG